jgi:hypothetical protein
MMLAVAGFGLSACRGSSSVGSSPEAGLATSAELTPEARVEPSGESPDIIKAPVEATNSPFHDDFCRPERYEGFTSEFPCAADSDCVPCECRPVNRDEHARLGGDAWCERFNQPPAREECIATNPACCEGRCVLAR